MIYLIGSIVLTSYLTLSFKVIERFQIPLLQSIVFNYFVCVITGSMVNNSFPVWDHSVAEPWFLWSVLMGSMFILLFNIMGYTTQKIGVAVSSVANKLSLIIPFLFSIYLYNEENNWLKILGIALALISVVLTCIPTQTNNPISKHVPLLLRVGLPAVLFFGSGLLDTLIKYVEQQYLLNSNSDDFLVCAFATAATFGSLIMLMLIFLKKQKFDWRSIVAGVAIGIPNYFSIWCLLRVLKQYGGNSSAIIPINNMGIVLFSSIVAWLLFRERLSIINWVGILLAIAAIALIAFA